MDGIVMELQALNIGKVMTNEMLTHHTTIKIGGPADLFIEPTSVENLKRVMAVIEKRRLNWRAIGRGSNLLVSDKGIEGVVLKLGNSLNQLEINGTKIIVGAGYSVVSLAVQISRN